MTYFLYNVATSLAVPLGAAWLASRPRHRPLLARFAPPLPPMLERPFWVQACSVGEVATARPIVTALRNRWPKIPVVLSVSTVSGHALAQATCTDATVTWFPFDHVLAVRRFLRRLNPYALVLVETEIWPNILRETGRLGTPVVLVNGRLSDKHYNRYAWLPALARPVFAQISAAGVQNDEYAERLVRLGTHPSAVRVTGNTKFDGVDTRIDAQLCNKVREENGFGADDPIVVFGSTRPGDEALAAQCWRTLRDEFPRLRLIVAPRHLERLHEAMAPFDEPLLRRAEVRRGRRPGSERVFILDTHGELTAFYAIATLAVIGGSFFPGVNGHNPLEPAALGAPTVFGPYMRNFIDPAKALIAAEGACQVDQPGQLAGVLRRFLSDPGRRARMAAQGRQAVLANQGAIKRNLDLLERVLLQACDPFERRC